MDRNVLVDANNLFHRAQSIFIDGRNAPLMQSNSGYPTGLIYGSLSMLTNFLDDIANPTRILLFLDGVPKRRREIHPNYKVKGPDAKLFHGHIQKPIDLCDGFHAETPIEVIVHLFHLLGLTSFYSPDEEADDMIASFVAQNKNAVNVIISSDKDFYQIVSGTVILYRPGVKGSRFFDTERALEHMKELYDIYLPASGVRMFKSFTGDPSDGIVGVPRIRKKLIAPLCSLPDVASVYATKFPGFSKNEISNCLHYRERVEMNFRLTELKHDILLDLYKQKFVPDFDTAFKILRDNFQIYNIDKYSFRTTNTNNLRISDAVHTQLDIPGFFSDSIFDEI